MAKKSSDKAFKFTSQHLVRLVVFFTAIAFVIYYLSLKQQEAYFANSPVLGEYTSQQFNPNLQPIIDSTWNILPESSRESMQNLGSTPLLLQAKEKISQIQQDAPKFIDDQFKEIKKSIVRNIADDIIENIESQ